MRVGLSQSAESATNFAESDGKPTEQEPRRRAPIALRLYDLGCLAWSKVSSADLHVVETAFA